MGAKKRQKSFELGRNYQFCRIWAILDSWELAANTQEKKDQIAQIAMILREDFTVSTVAYPGIDRSFKIGDDVTCVVTDKRVGLTFLKSYKVDDVLSDGDIHLKGETGFFGPFRFMKFRLNSERSDTSH